MASRKPDISLVALHRHDDGLNLDRTRSSSECSLTSSSDGGPTESSEVSKPSSSFYKSAQWTADGTTIITSSYDDQICSFVIPESLLEAREQPLSLRPQMTLSLAEPTNVVQPAPYFSLPYPDTHHVLVACRDHPIRIHQALPQDITSQGYDALQESKSGRTGFVRANSYAYHLVSPHTEAYLPVHSVVWSYPGSHFFVGSNNLIAQFNTSRIGSGPCQLVRTIPSKRHISKGNGVGMRGTVTTLSMQKTADGMSTGLIAAGTWSRWVGLYDFSSQGTCTSTWSIAAAAESVVVTDPPRDSGQPRPPTKRVSCKGQMIPINGIGGAGINQTIWSPCGRYLLVNERQSIGMLIYDVRVTGKLLGFLAGRDGLTHQRLDCDVYPGSESVGGFEVWAGTRDGTVKAWEGVGNTEGCLWPSWDFSGVESASALGSVAVHSSGSVVATCSGCWTIAEDNDDNSSVSSMSSLESLPSRRVGRSDKRFGESSLKLWRIGASTKDNAEAEDVTDAIDATASAGITVVRDVDQYVSKEEVGHDRYSLESQYERVQEQLAATQQPIRDHNLALQADDSQAAIIRPRANSASVAEATETVEAGGRAKDDGAAEKMDTS